MKKIIYIVLLMMCQVGLTQQDAIYSQYMFNPFAINPAYAGSRDAVNLVALNRSQWLGLEGAPTTQTISAHTPTNDKKLAWGLNFSHDKLGITNNLMAMATGAYQLRLETGTLNFGLRGGIYNTVIDQAKLNFREENDLLDTKTRMSALVPSFDFGLYYYTEKFYAGLSVNHLTKHRFNFENLENNQAYYLRRHVFLASGYVFKTSTNILIKPSILVKYAGPSTFNIDINTNVMFNELFWVGIGLRNYSSLNFLVDFNVTDYLRIGYSYDMNLTKINHYSNGSHELLIGLDFNLRKTSFATPRYL